MIWPFKKKEVPKTEIQIPEVNLEYSPLFRCHFAVYQDARIWVNSTSEAGFVEAIEICHEPSYLCPEGPHQTEESTVFCSKKPWPSTELEQYKAYVQRYILEEL